MRWLAIACVLGCGAPAPPPALVPPDPGFPLTPQALGPLSARTPATLIALRKALAGYDVIPVNVDTDPDKASLEYQVYDGTKLLFVIVPTSEGAILNVHVATPRATATGRPWRVGAPFSGAATLTGCECWGGKPVCFKKGEHVAVTFDRACRGTTDARTRRALEGVAIKRLVWRPRPFGGDEYGGDDYGGVEGGVDGGMP
jgi:hypothetical protein